jgi:hypothetical protein
MHISTLSKAIICVLQGDLKTLLTGTKIRIEDQIPETTEYVCD